MTFKEKQQCLARLQVHATANGAEAPTVLLACDGAPSAQVLDYCAYHGLTLDWVYLGAQPKHRLELTDVTS